MELKNREIISEPFNIIEVDDPFTCAIYNLLDLLGRSRFKAIAKHINNLISMVQQSKLGM